MLQAWIKGYLQVWVCDEDARAEFTDNWDLYQSVADGFKETKARTVGALQSSAPPCQMESERIPL